MSVAEGTGIIIGNSLCCGISTRIYSISYAYRVGSVVFSIHKAKKGILEPIGIKKVKVIRNAVTYGQTVALYTDMNNHLWNESELCSQTDAQAYAITYLTNLQQLLEEELANCPSP